MTSDNVKSILMLVTAAAVAYGLYRSAVVVGDVADKVGETLSTDLNPASDQNIIYSNTPDWIKEGLFSFYDAVGL
jgi:hypothetical protein